MIYFDDPEVGPEVFMGKDAERAARRRFEEVSYNWTCYLFKEVLNDKNTADRSTKLGKYKGN
jgi:hypothetical protein